MHFFLRGIGPALSGVLAVVSPVSAGFTLDISPETGFQTGVPCCSTKTATENYAYCAVSVEPLWRNGISESGSLIYGFPVSATYYFGGLYEFDLEPDLILEKRKGTTISRFGIEAAYYSEPADPDPTIPDQYFKYSLKLERKYGRKFSPAGKYALSVVHDPSTRRIDFANHLRFSVHHEASGVVMFSAGTGGVWSISNVRYAGFIQPSLSAGAVVAVSDRNTAILQVNASCAFHEKDSIPMLVKLNNSKKNPRNDTLYQISKPTIPFVSLYCGFEREVSKSITPHFYYMVSFYGNGESDRLSVSHLIGVICDWYRE